MKISIIGAGNMGGAIARGLASGHSIDAKDIYVSNPSNAKLEKLKAEYPEINTTNCNEEIVELADIVILAVKPWKIKEVMKTMNLKKNQILISVAAGIPIDELARCASLEMAIFRVIPNTAISEKASMTLIAGRNACSQQTEQVMNIFNEMGLAIMIDENLLAAGTSLTSCGIAYVMKYVEAGMLAGTELGIRPADSMKMLAQTLEGAAKLLLKDENTRPALEIEKVTTPGGLTIKGVNQLEKDGFTKAIINAMKASL